MNEIKRNYKVIKSKKSLINLRLEKSKHFLVLSRNLYLRSRSTDKKGLRLIMMNQLCEFKIIIEETLERVKQLPIENINDISREEKISAFGEDPCERKCKNCSFCQRIIRGEPIKIIHICGNDSFKKKKVIKDPDQYTDCKFWDGLKVF